MCNHHHIDSIESRRTGKDCPRGNLSKRSRFELAVRVPKGIRPMSQPTGS